ncbi:MAG: sulfatase [Verrucomicrobia bacterium]|nr:sulfatase [Verrucomicrobiota bacterium]
MKSLPDFPAWCGRIRALGQYFLILVANLFLGAIVLFVSHPSLNAGEQPNIVLIFCDDLGYGDLGSYGHPTIRTPNLDRMAGEGMRLTDFYSAASVCTPSRAALMTGRYPLRSGMCSDRRRVLFPDSLGGLPESEWTMAEALKSQGYATAAVGKWHLGHRPQFLPTKHGFDSYYGIPYSNDMDRLSHSPGGSSKSLGPQVGWWNVPLLRNEKVVERPVDQTTITRRYTRQAAKFIESNREKPFFLYLAHSMPHVPLFRSPQFEDHSLRGLYGDVIEEIDWSVGQLLNTLAENGLDENTLVFFTSDNGPWLTQGPAGGTAGLLREGKGSTWEGGMREPAIAWWPGKIKEGSVSSELASTLDLFPTFLNLAGGSPLKDLEIDGHDMASLLFDNGPSARHHFGYYRGEQLFALRMGAYKAHFSTKSAYGRDPVVTHERPLIFNLLHDPSERFDLGGSRAELVKAFENLRVHYLNEVDAAPTQLESRAKN